MLGDVENETLASLLDPFGPRVPSAIATKYWTVAERNTRILELAGTFLQNRLLWIGRRRRRSWPWPAGASRFKVVESRRARPAAAQAPRTVQAVEDQAVRPIAPVAARRHGLLPTVDLSQLWTQTRFEIGGVLKSLAFPIILAFGVLNMVGNATARSTRCSAPPSTR